MNKPLVKLVDALDRLKKCLDVDEVDAIVRDAAIKRFEICFELAWKAVQKAARDEGLDCASPKSCFQHAWRLGWVDEAPAITMIEDRNLTVHTYDEKLAIQVHERLGAHYDCLKGLSNELVKRTTT